MSQPEISAGLDTSVLIPLLTGQPVPLAVLAREYLAEVEESGSVVFEKAAQRLPNVIVLS